MRVMRDERDERGMELWVIEYLPTYIVHSERADRHHRCIVRYEYPYLEHRQPKRVEPL